MASDAGMFLEDLAPEFRLRGSERREIHGADFNSRIDEMLLKVIGDGFRFRLRHGDVLKGPLWKVPAVSFRVEVRLLSGEPANEPCALIFAPAPHQIRSLKLEPRLGLAFYAVAIHTLRLDKPLAGILRLSEAAGHSQHSSDDRGECADPNHPEC